CARNTADGLPDSAVQLKSQNTPRLLIPLIPLLQLKHQ
ncbi:hypothetical protein scyTo_0011473, partial [Scyliorhinus torazame]|nr:hypothetical protein [Scyliorhinus torazame]